MYKQGDLISVPFPFTDLTSAKPRPAIVISNSTIDNTGDLIIVMVTSQYRTDGINIPIGPNDVNVDLPKQSYVRCHRIATIDRNIISSKIGETESVFLSVIIETIKSVFDKDKDGLLLVEEIKD